MKTNSNPIQLTLVFLIICYFISYSSCDDGGHFHEDVDKDNIGENGLEIISNEYGKGHIFDLQ